MTNTQILIAAIALVLAAVYFWMSRKSDDAPAKDAKPLERAKPDVSVDDLPDSRAAKADATAKATAKADDDAAKAKAAKAKAEEAAEAAKADEEAKAKARAAKAEEEADAARAEADAAKAKVDADAAAAVAAEADAKAKAEAKAKLDADAAAAVAAEADAKAKAEAKAKADADASAAAAKAKADADAAAATAKAKADADAAAAAKAKADADAIAAAAARAKAEADAAAAAKAKAEAARAEAARAEAARAEAIKTPLAESFGGPAVAKLEPAQASTPSMKAAAAPISRPEAPHLPPPKSGDDSKATTPYARAEAKPAPAPAPAPAAAKPAVKDEFDLRLDDLEAKPKVAEAPAPVAAAKPAGPVSPTAELEKAEPDHAKARRFARVAVSEIKLYHEQEVKDGRAAKDLWKRLNQDIMMSIQTYEKRVPQEVRDRFDYLYDELVRQLAEGKPELLGPEAPTSTAKAAPLKK